MRPLSLIIAWLALAAAAFPSPVVVPGGGFFTVKTNSFADMKFIDVERQRQDLSCGAAALATVLKHYWEADISEADVIAGAIATGDKAKIEREGFSMLELKRFAEARGYVSQGFRLDDAAKLRKLTVPVIALANVRGYAHFIVIKQVVGDRVLIADPAFGNRVEPLDQFQQSWSKVLLVVVDPKDEGRRDFIRDATLRAPFTYFRSLLDWNLDLVRPGLTDFDRREQIMRAFIYASVLALSTPAGAVGTAGADALRMLNADGVPLRDEEMGKLRGGFRGVAFSAYFNAVVDLAAPTNTPINVDPTAPPPQVVIGNGTVDVQTVLGTFGGTSGVFQVAQVNGNHNIVTNNMYLQVAIIDASNQAALGNLSSFFGTRP